MPKNDGTGPLGKGPLTGKGQGFALFHYLIIIMV